MSEVLTPLFQNLNNGNSDLKVVTFNRDSTRNFISDKTGKAIIIIIPSTAIPGKGGEGSFISVQNRSLYSGGGGGMGGGVPMPFVYFTIADIESGTIYPVTINSSIVSIGNLLSVATGTKGGDGLDASLNDGGDGGEEGTSYVASSASDVYTSENWFLNYSMSGSAGRNGDSYSSYIDPYHIFLGGAGCYASSASMIYSEPYIIGQIGGMGQSFAINSRNTTGYWESVSWDDPDEFGVYTKFPIGESSPDKSTLGMIFIIY